MSNLENIDPASLHSPVLLSEVLDTLQPVPGGKYLDATLGMGGHAESILKAAPKSELCGLDRDKTALELARKRLAEYRDRTHYFHLPFADFAQALTALAWKNVDGVLADLGISSMQLDWPERGISFSGDGPLDMRMNPQVGTKTAADLLNRLSFEELKNIIALYGEDPQAARIARRIVEERQKNPLSTTLQLAELVRSSYPATWRRKARRHPATRTFQALRIAVNQELEQLEFFLEHILAWLKPGGRLVVITFHSLEDRIVKNAIRHWEKGCICPPSQVLCTCDHKPEVKKLYKKPVCATEAELLLNPRASSAKLRAVEKLGN